MAGRKSDALWARIVMIEDQVSYGEAFGVALSLTRDLRLVGSATTVSAGLTLCREQDPDLVICDYRLSSGELGIDAVRRLRADRVATPVVFLTGYLAPQVRREAAGFDDVYVISKNDRMSEIIADLRAVVKGAQPRRLAVPESLLADGELQVLESMSKGKAPWEIASELHLSLHTIRSRTKTMYRKLQVTSQTEALVVALRHGLVVPPN